MFRIAIASLTATLFLSGTVLGQNAAPAVKDDKEATKPGPPSQRYRFSHTAEGILRLDQESGQVVLCRALGNGWACNPAPDETAVLQIELKRKDEEVKKLNAQFDQLKADFAAQSAEAGKQAISQEERRSLVSRLALLEQDNSGLHGALKRLEDENAKLKKQLAAAPKAPDLEPAVAQSLTSIDAIKRELAAVREQLAAVQKQLPDQGERNAQQAEIARLKAENAALGDKVVALQIDAAMMQSQIASLKPPLPAAPPLPSASVPPDKKDELKLPSRDEIERVRAAVVDAWRRVMEMVGQLQKDMTGKGEPPVRL